MQSLKTILASLRRRISIRLLVALILLAASFRLMALAAEINDGFGSFPAVLLSMALLVLAVIILAPSIARGLVDKVADIFMYSEKFDRAPPMYGRPAALRKSREYEEAMAAYEEIAEEYPDEIKPYLEMIDMAMRDLNDPERAELIYQQGLLKFQNEEDRKRLARQLSGLRLKA